MMYDFVIGENTGNSAKKNYLPIKLLITGYNARKFRNPFK